MTKTIAVIFGGMSNENEVSVITGTMAINVLKNGGDSVVPVYISQSGEIYSDDILCDVSNFKNSDFTNAPRAVIADGGVYTFNKRGKVKKFRSVDVALNCCHGGAGEGGGVCGLCSLGGIPLASAGIFESASFMNKYFTKLVLKSLGIKTADYTYIKSLSDVDVYSNILKFPSIVKPVNLGSSIGIEKVDNLEELKAAVECALVYDDAVIVEEYLKGRKEINCAAYFAHGKVITSECEEVAGGEILSFEDKYCGGAKSVLPANLEPSFSSLIKNITRAVYTRLEMRGIVRFDFILSGGKVYLSEINTVPGSLSYYLLSAGFKDFYKVLSAVMEQAIEDNSTRKNKKIITTGILENITPSLKLGRK